MKYGYDMAVLAGDGLMIYAFETAAKALALGAIRPGWPGAWASWRRRQGSMA